MQHFCDFILFCGINNDKNVHNTATCSLSRVTCLETTAVGMVNLDVLIFCCGTAVFSMLQFVTIHQKNV